MSDANKDLEIAALRDENKDLKESNAKLGSRLFCSVFEDCHAYAIRELRSSPDDAADFAYVFAVAVLDRIDNGQLE